MTKQEQLNNTARRNPGLRQGTWDRIRLYALQFNMDALSDGKVLEKIIHDHCDLKSVPNPFDKVRKN
jgi:hypothetical protein